MMEKINWGILGTGAIAHKFASDLKLLPNAKIMSVGSRTQSSADAFGKKYEIEHCHGSYPELAHNPQVDVVYIATPHSCHMENSLLCLEAGKAVLCEKPFTINTQQAEKVVALAKQKNLFLMEAMWTHFFPVMRQVRILVQEGTIGDLGQVTADFGFSSTVATHPRLFDPALGGGALLDVGVYPVSLAHKLLGPPAELKALAKLCAAGVDEQNAIIYTTARKQLALLSSAITLVTAQEAYLVGTKGRIHIPTPWWRPDRFRLRINDKTEEIEIPLKGHGYHFEAQAVMDCLRQGKKESDIVPLDETLAVMKILDLVRRQTDLRYPVE